MPLLSRKKLEKIRLSTLNNLKDLRVKIVQRGLTWRTKAKENVDKIKSPYNLQPIDKYLRQAEYDIPPGTPNYLNAFLEGKQQQQQQKP